MKTRFHDRHERIQYLKAREIARRILAEPVLTGSGLPEPALTNPALTDPGLANPARTRPRLTGEVLTDPTRTEPALTRPRLTREARTDPTLTDPTLTGSALIESARRFLEAAMAPDPHQSTYTAIWRDLLNRPPAEIAAALIEDTSRGQLLRETAPVFGPGLTSREIVALMDEADASPL